MNKRKSLIEKMRKELSAPEFKKRRCGPAKEKEKEKPNAGVKTYSNRKVEQPER